MAEGRGGTREPRRASSFAGDESGGIDLLRTVRERPLVALGMFFGAGVLLALVSSRGGMDEEEEVVKAAEPQDPDARAVLWERRARRLQRIAREQALELSRLRRKGGDSRDVEDDDMEDDDGPGGGLAELFSAGLQKIVRNAGAGD